MPGTTTFCTGGLLSGYDLGIGFVPMDFLEKENRENLVILNMAPDIPARNICLLKRRGISLSIAASEFENRIKDKKKEE